MAGKSLKNMTNAELATFVGKQFPGLQDAIQSNVVASGYTGEILLKELLELDMGDLKTSQFYKKVFSPLSDEALRAALGGLACRSVGAKLATIFEQLKSDGIKIAFPGCTSEMKSILDSSQAGHMFALFAQLPAERVESSDAYFPEDDFWVIAKGGQPYVAPMGWTRASFKPKTLTESTLESVLKDWPLVYHGTSASFLESIFSVGLVKPGDKGLGGAAVPMGVGACGADKPTIYLSPSTEYAAHWLYTKDEKHAAEAEKGYAQFVLEVRVRPDAVVKKQGNTLGKAYEWPSLNLPYDTLFDWQTSGGNLEWLVHDPSAIHLTGILFRVLPEKPRDFNSSRANNMKSRVKWDESKRIVSQRALGNGKWYWCQESWKGVWKNEKGQSNDFEFFFDGPVMHIKNSFADSVGNKQTREYKTSFTSEEKDGQIHLRFKFIDLEATFTLTKDGIPAVLSSVSRRGGHGAEDKPMHGTFQSERDYGTYEAFVKNKWWIEYSADLSAKIEKDYQKWLRICFLGRLPNGHDYYIDFEHADGMCQVRADGTRDEDWRRRYIERRV